MNSEAPMGRRYLPWMLALAGLFALRVGAQLVQRAAGLGLGVIVGAQVGETSILTRAGLTVMHAARPNLVASEGAFGTHLLKRDLTSESLMFGDDGAIIAERESVGAAPGLGLEVRREGLVPLPFPSS